jgi:uncharacterized membrane protein YedE/YeeE
MQQFTPYSAVIGGALIGVAAALLFLLNGRIAGVSGILGGLLDGAASGKGERIAFIVGLIAGPLVLAALWERPPVTIEASTLHLAAAGLLVGFGTRLGSGCTSGHGVCGVARLSPRSLIATMLFVLAGMATVYVVRHLVTGG